MDSCICSEGVRFLGPIPHDLNADLYTSDILIDVPRIDALA